MKRANLIRGLLILAAAAFFAYRYSQAGGVVYPALLLIFAAAGLVSLLNRLPARWQNIMLNLGIVLFFGDLVFAELNLAELGRAFAQANYWMMIPATLFVLTHLYFRTLRSQALLKPMGEVGFWPAFRALTIGITANAVLPARAGEFLRAYVLSRSTGLPATGAFANVVVERILDGLTVLLVLVAVVALGVRNESLQQAGLGGAVLYVGALAALIVFLRHRHWADRLIHKFVPHNLAQPLLKILDGFTSGLAILKNPRQIALVLLWNTFTWIPIPLALWFALLAFDFGAPIPWQTPVLMLPALALALTIPGAPAGVGLVQFAVKLTMDSTFAGLPVVANFDELVAAASIVIHVSQFLPEIIPGILSFMIEGLSAKDLSAGRAITGGETPASSPLS